MIADVRAERRAAPALDVAADLRVAFRKQSWPAVQRFVDDEISADAFAELFTRYYRGPLADYDRALSALWHAGRTCEIGVQAAGPDSQAEDADILRFYPLSICHHNLYRLVSVLQVELGGRMASHTDCPLRIYDLGVFLEKLDALLDELAGNNEYPNEAEEF